jgi:hypothetical protein
VDRSPGALKRRTDPCPGKPPDARRPQELAGLALAGMGDAADQAAARFPFFFARAS